MLCFFIDGRNKNVSYNLFTKLCFRKVLEMKVFHSFLSVVTNSFSATLTQTSLKKVISTNLIQISVRKGVCLRLRRARHSALILKLYPSLSLSYTGVAHLCPGQEMVYSRTYIQCRHTVAQWQKSAIVRG